MVKTYFNEDFYNVIIIIRAVPVRVEAILPGINDVLRILWRMLSKKMFALDTECQDRRVFAVMSCGSKYQHL